MLESLVQVSNYHTDWSKCLEVRRDLGALFWKSSTEKSLISIHCYEQSARDKYLMCWHQDEKKPLEQWSANELRNPKKCDLLLNISQFLYFEEIICVRTLWNSTNLSWLTVSFIWLTLRKKSDLTKAMYVHFIFYLWFLMNKAFFLNQTAFFYFAENLKIDNTVAELKIVSLQKK